MKKVRNIVKVASMGFVLLAGFGFKADSCSGTVEEDADGDGFSIEQGDCNDEDMNAHPGANDITGDIVKVVASFEKHEAAREAILWLNQHYSSGKAELEEVIGDDWRDAWKEHFKPFSLTSQITVTPPWVDYQAQRPKEKILILEPGRAFGTGLHATTSLVAQLLDEKLEEKLEQKLNQKFDEKLAPIHQELRKHTEILQDHGRILGEHGKELQKHGKMLRSLKKDQDIMLRFLDKEQMDQRKRLVRIEKHLMIAPPTS